MKTQFNRHFYRTLVFWLGLICLGIELYLWPVDDSFLRMVGLGTGGFLVVLSFWREVEED
ncbi:hypothetical protein [Levilactobacillus wangkuiensis]|uniref:hypothetical protein n=1 Tax=Levilactobacillus wangkuiensis TaxID=2799566 RepID=UPI00194510F2|nr:hypothetical protein [Levilactobacillus wangkuiensis]